MPVLREHLQLKPTEEHAFSDNSNPKQMCLPNLWDFSERVEIPDFQSPAAWLVDFPDTPMIALSQISTQIYLVKGRFQRKNHVKSLVIYQTSLDPHGHKSCKNAPISTLCFGKSLNYAW